MTAWDPVGAGFEPNAWDEYDDYAFGVARQLYEAPNAEVAREQVARALDEAETDFMGTESSGRSSSTQQLATALVAWHEWSFVRAGVNGHRFLPTGGHRISPTAAMFSPRWRPRFSPPRGSPRCRRGALRP